MVPTASSEATLSASRGRSSPTAGSRASGARPTFLRACAAAMARVLGPSGPRGTRHPRQCARPRKPFWRARVAQPKRASGNSAGRPGGRAGLAANASATRGPQRNFRAGAVKAHARSNNILRALSARDADSGAWRCRVDEAKLQEGALAILRLVTVVSHAHWTTTSRPDEQDGGHAVRPCVARQTIDA